MQNLDQNYPATNSLARPVFVKWFYLIIVFLDHSSISMVVCFSLLICCIVIEAKDNTTHRLKMIRFPRLFWDLKLFNWDKTDVYNKENTLYSASCSWIGDKNRSWCDDITTSSSMHFMSWQDMKCMDDVVISYGHQTEF